MSKRIAAIEDAAARIVAAGLGPAVLPREAIELHAGAAGLAVVPLSDAWARRRFVIATRADGSLSATTRLLVEHLGRAHFTLGGGRRARPGADSARSPTTFGDAA